MGKTAKKPTINKPVSVDSVELQLTAKQKDPIR
jgi:hypothetical protein